MPDDRPDLTTPAKPPRDPRTKRLRRKPSGRMRLAATFAVILGLAAMLILQNLDQVARQP